jgi:hypothetical protein
MDIEVSADFVSARRLRAVSREQHSRPAFVLRALGMSRAPPCGPPVAGPTLDAGSYQCGELFEYGHAVLLLVVRQPEHPVEEQANPHDEYQGRHRNQQAEQKE